MNVLYVTPDLGESDILRREFSALHPDLRLESTATPREAIERLEAGTSHYDAVLIELTQMNGEGLSLVRHIRKNNRFLTQMYARFWNDLADHASA